jgi:GDP-L-fucose synthase
MLNSYKKQYGLNSISIIPPNLYGPNDSFDLEHCHVLSALVKRFSDAVSNNDKEITLWGTGIARREFMHVDDLAKSVVYLLEKKVEKELINIGWGKDISIKELAEIIAKKTGFSGEIQWDSSKPNGMLKKCMNIDRMNELSITPNIKLNDGVDEMIKIYKNL